MNKLVWVGVFLTIAPLHSMQNPQEPQIVWAKPRTQPMPQEHPIIVQLQEKLLGTARGVELVRRHVQTRQASASALEGLDIAEGRTSQQNMLKVAALLKADNSKDPHGHVLHETLCSPQALDTWRSLLSKKPRLHNAGWSQEQDATFAQKILKSTRLAAHLKNRHVLAKEHRQLLSTERAPLFSPDFKYMFIRDADMVGKVIDSQTHEVIYTLTNMVESQECSFSQDGSLCFLQQGTKHVDHRVTWNGTYYTNTDLIAVDLKTRTRIETALGTRDVNDRVPASAYSKTGRFSILKPSYNVTPRMGIYDAHAKEVIVKFPEMINGHAKTVSISPQEKYSFFYTQKGLKLFDLTKGGAEVKEFNAELYEITHSDTNYWVPHQEMCLLPTNHEGKGVVYTVYYPETNSSWVLEPSSYNFKPCYSLDGRFCFLTNRENGGYLYDLVERKIVKTFEAHRVFDVECPPVFFSEDPLYPYCMVPVWDTELCEKFNISKNSQDAIGAMKVVLFNYQTDQEVTEISEINGAEMIFWPKEGPYYFILYPDSPHEIVAENSRLDFNQCHRSMDLRKKKNHALVMHINDAAPVQLCYEKQYVSIQSSKETSILIDTITQQQLASYVHNWTVLPNGQMIQFTGKQLIELAPQDCSWDGITSQQVFFILYALEQCKKGSPLNLNAEDSKPLKLLFESLGENMQTYVADACQIKR